MKALVTGDRGFLGSLFSAELRARQYDVAGLDVKNGPIQDCRAFFRKNPAAEFDLVVHCAAVIGGRRMIDGAPLATSVNLSLDAELFRWASIARPGRVIYISSSAAYPVYMQQFSSNERRLREEDLSGWTEDNCVSPDQIYGWTKFIGELLSQELRNDGVPVTVVRPFSGYGKDQDDTYPFGAFLRRAFAHANPFEVWGTGEQVRDFIHGTDIVRGALAVAESGTSWPVNLCTGRPTSFNALARMITTYRGYTPRIENLQQKPSGVQYRVGDPTRMRMYYTPRITLEEGIQAALRWDF